VFCFDGVTVSPQVQTGRIIASQTDAVKTDGVSETPGTRIFPAGHFNSRKLSPADMVGILSQRVAENFTT